MADIEGGQPQHKSKEQRKGELELYKAALSGDWSKAKQIFDKPGQQITPSSRINAQGETALHIAAAAGHFDFVRNLVDMITKGGNTADLAITSEVAGSDERRGSENPTQSTEERNTADLAIRSEVAVSDERRESDESENPAHGTEEENTADSAIRREVAVPGERRESDESENPTQSTEERNTAFFYAAASGSVKIAKILIEKNPDLATVRGRGNNLPIYMAALLGHYQMVRYLYDLNPERAEYTDDDYFYLLVALIDSDIYDVALQIVQEKRSTLATKTDSNGETALHAFARKPDIPLNLRTLNIIRAARLRLLKIFRKPKNEWLEVVKLLWEQVILEDHKTISKLMIGKSGSLIFIAAKQGNYEFLATLIRSYPDLILQVDENNYTIFHIAVLHRRAAIFNLIHKIGSIKNFICMKIDREGNNILHLAGKLPLTTGGIRYASDAALQLQLELAWFKAVKKIVGLQQRIEENKKGKTPIELFEEEHEKLRKEGEKWMKSIARSCMLISTLVATVVFAAAFAVRGGVRHENGVPILLNNEAVRDFATSDAMSLIASSIFCFLSILTSSYSIDGFRISLPIKLILGLFFLYGSILTMMAAFTNVFATVFKPRKTAYVDGIDRSAYVPGLLFFLLCLFPLVMRVEISTVLSFELFRPNKRSLFLGTDEE